MFFSRSLVAESRVARHGRHAGVNPSKAPRALRLAIAALLGLGLAIPALAVQAGRWTHTTEADFVQGQTKDTVVTNLGDVKLAARTEVIGKIPEQASIIYTVQPMPNGDVYLAVGPEPKLLRRRGEKIEEILTLKNEQLFAMTVDAKGRLLLGLSAAKASRLAVLDADKADKERIVPLLYLEGVRYIWDLSVDGSKVVLATGAEGRVLLADLDRVPKAAATAPASAPALPSATAATSAPSKEKAKEGDKPGKDGKKQLPSKPLPVGVTELLNTPQSNILCLARDKQGRVYAGTDTDGLIYRLTIKPDGTADSFVLYDANEPEIGSIVVFPDGTVFAGTADAEQARPGRLSEATSTESGRPEVSEGGAIVPPKEGKMPPQVPPQPKPIGEGKPTGKVSGKDLGKGAAKTEGKADAKPDVQPGKEAAPSHEAQGENENDHTTISPDEPAVDEQMGEDAARSTPRPVPLATPVPESDSIRAMIAQRMREAGVAAGGPQPMRPAVRRTPSRPPAPAPGRPGGPGAPSRGPREGNAIYRITPDGFVTEVFRESVMILKLINDEGKLIVATGNEGLIFRVDPAAGETTVLADLEAQQTPAMAKAQDGSILLGTANPAQLLRLDPGFAKEGQYTSVVLDAGHICLWGTAGVYAELPAGTLVTIESRSGNVHEPDEAAWSPWQELARFKPEAGLAPGAPREAAVKSPPARFLQYRLKFQGQPNATPSVHRVELAYLVPNLKPSVSSITANYADAGTPTGPANASQGPGAGPSGGGPRPMGVRPMGAPRGGGGGEAVDPEPAPALAVEWEASDPNNDRLRFTLEYQALGSDKWIPLAKDLDAPAYEWNTRRVPDGRYILRVTATDLPDNTPDMALSSTRVSDPIVIDNTPPEFEKVKGDVAGNTVSLTGVARDALTPIRAIHYAVDQTDKWTPVLPDDKIFDSTAEAFTIKIPDLSPGPHVVTLRVVDGRSNVRYLAERFDVNKP